MFPLFLLFCLSVILKVSSFSSRTIFHGISAPHGLSSSKSETFMTTRRRSHLCASPEEAPFSDRFAEMIRSGKLPSSSPQQQAALQKTVQLMTAVNKVQDELASTEVAGEAGGLAEAPPPIPTPPHLRGEAAKSFEKHQKKNNSVLPGYYGYSIGTPIIAGEDMRKDEALVRVVYRGSGQPERVELNDACMNLDTDVLETWSLWG
eukprot:GHVS01108095.1.p1 GENE.GHVS01108095.1~~GHVS01108095.1.p1  ORF type:complete len:205 (+),score=53.33 GHVS01108095.1:147-761(+)